VRLFPQTLINVRLSPGQDWQTHAGLQAQREQVETELGDSGRILIRASGTEPVLRIMVEAQDGALAQACAERMAQALAPR
jgi:phosphoglucosamine mutase